MRLVAQTLTSWNRILVWLQNMDLLRRTGALTLPDAGQDASRAGRKCSLSTSQKSVEPRQTGLREAG
jgi:hypothetical protein